MSLKNLFNRFVSGNFGASLAVSKSKNGEYLNYSLAIFGGKEFVTKKKAKGMSISVSRYQLVELRDAITDALQSPDDEE